MILFDQHFFLTTERENNKYLESWTELNSNHLSNICSVATPQHKPFVQHLFSSYVLLNSNHLSNIFSVATQHKPFVQHLLSSYSTQTICSTSVIVATHHKLFVQHLFNSYTQQILFFQQMFSSDSTPSQSLATQHKPFVQHMFSSYSTQTICPTYVQ